MFFPKPCAHRDKEKLHLLDVRSVLAFCLECTKSLSSSMKLFIVVADKAKGYLFQLRISSWISFCIFLCYQLANITSPARVLALSSRVQATLAAFLAQLLTVDICKAATWSLAHIFASDMPFPISPEMMPVSDRLSYNHCSGRSRPTSMQVCL